MIGNWPILNRNRCGLLSRLHRGAIWGKRVLGVKHNKAEWKNHEDSKYAGKDHFKLGYIILDGLYEEARQDTIEWLVCGGCHGGGGWLDGRTQGTVHHHICVITCHIQHRRGAENIKHSIYECGKAK